MLAFAACAHSKTSVNPCQVPSFVQPIDCWSKQVNLETLVAADLPVATDSPLSADEIERVRRLNAPGLRACAAAASFAGFDAAGPVGLRVWVERDGYARAVRIVGDESLAPGYARCLAMCVSTWRFAAHDESLRIAEIELGPNRMSGPYTATECSLQSAILKRGAAAMFTCSAHFTHSDTRLLVHLDGNGNVADVRVPTDHDPSNEFTRCLKGMLQRRPFRNPSGHDVFWRVNFRHHP